jgi:DNA-binding SARP family transcriptional activator
MQVYGSAARSVFRELAAVSQDDLARGARALAAAIPAGPVAPLEIRLLGPLELRMHGERMAPPELRRERVRHLLIYLVIHRSVDREILTAALWPDADARSGPSNLRVNLTHLLRALEPDRSPGEASFFVRQDQGRLALSGEPFLRIDLDELSSRLERAAAATESGTHTLALEHLEAAVALWRGEPFEDARFCDWAIPVAERITARYVAARAEAGALRHAAGDHDAAAAHATAALAVDAWREPAHRVLISARLGRGDRVGAQREAKRCLEALRELGEEPEHQTLQLLRRLGLWRDAAQG